MQNHPIMETTEKNKSEMAVIKEFVYEFKALDRLPIDLSSKSKIFLIINDIETSIPIESLFIGKIAFDDEDITGYSILQLITNGTQLKIDEATTLKITFIDKASGKTFQISKIRRSLFYDDDMEISVESRLKYIDLLLTTSMIPVNAQKEAQENERIKSEQESTRLLEEERVRKEAEKALVLGGESWEDQRSVLIESGHDEYIYENYRMFYRKAQGEEPAEIGFFILSPGDFEFIELFEEEITEQVEEYSFDDENKDEHRITFNKLENKIEVEKI